MFIKNIFYTILYVLQLQAIQVDEFKTKDKTMKLSPVELIDLVLEEQALSHSPTTPITDLNEVSCSGSDEDDVKEGIEQATKDEERLKSRKVWSRWSKWSGCSVSCGDGNMVRWRMCVAGRCAPNEREEQRRPCSRAPCDSIDDMHESE